MFNKNETAHVHLGNTEVNTTSLRVVLQVEVNENSKAQYAQTRRQTINLLKLYGCAQLEDRCLRIVHQDPAYRDIHYSRREQTYTMLGAALALLKWKDTHEY